MCTDTECDLNFILDTQYIHILDVHLKQATFKNCVLVQDHALVSACRSQFKYRSEFKIILCKTFLFV